MRYALLLLLDIDQSSRVFVPALRRQGYRVQFRQFDGPHTIPPEVAKEAVRWWLVDKCRTGFSPSSRQCRTGRRRGVTSNRKSTCPMPRVATLNGLVVPRASPDV